jgi:hypothetical protein
MTNYWMGMGVLDGGNGCPGWVWAEPRFPSLWDWMGWDTSIPWMISLYLLANVPYEMMLQLVEHDVEESRNFSLKHNMGTWRT